MYLNEFDQIVKEHFDLSDKDTRKYIVSLEAGDEDQVLAALSAKLYDNIINRVGDIDFGTIPRSRGDITKVEKFNMTEESLSIIRQLVLEYQENPAQVDVIMSAIQNVKDSKSLFMKAFALNVEMPMLIYNLVVLSIIRSTSMIIATCVKYVADPSTQTMKRAFDKVAYRDTESDMIYQQLVTFNEVSKDGSLVKLLNAVIKNNRNLKEDVDFSDKDDYYPADTIMDPIDTVNSNDSDESDSPIAGAEPYPNAAIPTPQEEDNDQNTEPAPNPQSVPGTDMIGQDVPDAADIIPEVPNDTEGPQDNAPQNPTVAGAPADVKPVIPENKMATNVNKEPVHSDQPGVKVESVEKNIETDTTFEKELAGAKESPIDDKDSDDLRSGREKYNSQYIEAIKQKILKLEGVENIETDSTFEKELAGAKESPIDDKCDTGLRLGKEKYDSNNVEGKKQEVVGTALENTTNNQNVNIVSTKGSSLKEHSSEGPIEDKNDTDLRTGKEKYDSNNVEGKKQEVVGEGSLEKLKDLKGLGNSTQGKVAIGAGTIIGVIYGTKIAYALLIKVIIPWMRALVYQFNYSRMKISDFLQIQAELIESNADELETTTSDDQNKAKQIAKKQRKWADIFRKWSNIFNIDRKQSAKNASDNIAKDEKDKNKIGKNDEGDSILF